MMVPMASAPGKHRPEMPGRVRQATLVLLGPDQEWRNWCARALAVNRLHPLVFPPRPKEPTKPGAVPVKPAAKAGPEADPWPYPFMMIETEKVRQRLLAIEAVAMVVHEDDDHQTVRGLVDLVSTTLGPGRASLTVVCERRDSSWLKDDLAKAFPVTVTVLSRRGDSLTLLRRVRRTADGKRAARLRQAQ
jgi:hypothetical protein